MVGYANYDQSPWKNDRFFCYDLAIALTSNPIDILLNMLVCYCSIEEKYGGLSRRPSHISDRHKCFQLLADTYGPLQQYLPECTVVVPDED